MGEFCDMEKNVFAFLKNLLFILNAPPNSRWIWVEVKLIVCIFVAAASWTARSRMVTPPTSSQTSEQWEVWEGGEDQGVPQWGRVCAPQTWPATRPAAWTRWPGTGPGWTPAPASLLPPRNWTNINRHQSLLSQNCPPFCLTDIWYPCWCWGWSPGHTVSPSAPAAQRSPDILPLDGDSR